MASKRTKKKTTGAHAKGKKKPAARSRRRRASPPDTAPPSAPPGVAVIRKYANRRLYDTTTSRHITQEDLYRMVTHGTIVRILDASTEEDITNQTLALALIEHDPAKLRLMPTWLLHQMIRLHEQALGGWINTLWQPFASGAMPMPGWPPSAGVWPGSAGPAGASPWNPWAPVAAPGPVPASAAQEAASGRGSDLDELRREVARLLARLGELEQPG